MRCCKCPLFLSWNNETESGEACVLFGDSWDSRFQYENKEQTEVIGCYIEKAYIEKVDKDRMEYYSGMSF